MEQVKEFIVKYKKWAIIIGIIIIVAIIAAVLLGTSKNPIAVQITSRLPSAIKSESIEVEGQATDEKGKKYEVQWKVSGGTLNNTKGAKVRWVFPKEEGTYKIMAYVGDNKIVKSVTVLGNATTEYLTYEAQGVKNIDADHDGLSDVYESTIASTDPNKADSDEDGLEDAAELIFGFDPKNPDSKSDGVKDSERKVTYDLQEEKEGMEIQIDGYGNIHKTSINKLDIGTIKDLDATLLNTYNVTFTGTIEQAKLKINYDASVIASKGLEEDALSLYKISEETNEFEKIESSINKETSSISAMITKSGNYFIADTKKMASKIATEVMFVIDNSGSMYPAEQIPGSKENDVDYKRVDLSIELINKMKGDYKFGAGKFTSEYVNLSGLTSDKEAVKQKINEIKNGAEKFTGTYIGAALDGGLLQFNEESNARKFLILLTDGQDTKDIQGYDNTKLKKAVDKAIEKNVKVFTIGIGEEVDNNSLKTIATKTNAKSYFTATAEGLEGIFDLIAAEMNYDLLDTNNDGTDDSIIIKDSGFMAKRDGLKFANIATNKSQSGAMYGMNLLAKLYYEKNLPTSLSAMTITLEDGTQLKASGYSFDKNGLLATGTAALVEYRFTNLTILNQFPSIFWTNTVTDGVLQIASSVAKNLSALGFEPYTCKYTKDKANFSSYQNIRLNMNSEKYTKSTSAEERQLFNAIYRLDILKNKDEEISFEQEPDKAMERVENMLAQGEPVLLKVNKNYSLLATKILLDVKDANYLKFEVYDPNYPAEVRYMEIKKDKLFKMSNGINSSQLEQYSFKYNGEKVTVAISIPSLETKL